MRNFIKPLVEQMRNYLINPLGFRYVTSCCWKEDLNWPLFLWSKPLNDLSPVLYEKLIYLQKGEYNGAYFALCYGLFKGLLEKSDLSGKILDFGCGNCASSLLLLMQSANVTAVDIDPYETLDEVIVKFPKENRVVGDGFEFMDRQPEGSYDLVTAFMLGQFDPEEFKFNAPHDFVERFYKTTRRVVKPRGKILITSDRSTMETVREVFNSPLTKKDHPHILIHTNS